MKAKQFIFLVLLGCCLSSCYTVNTYYVSAQKDYEDFLIGKSYKEIVMHMGMPQRTTRDPNLGKVITYEEYSTRTSSSQYSSTDVYATGVGNSVYGDGTTSSVYNTHSRENRDYLDIFFNDKDICYAVRTNYTKAVDKKEKDERATKALIGGLAGFFGGLAIFIPMILLLAK